MNRIVLDKSKVQNYSVLNLKDLSECGKLVDMSARGLRLQDESLAAKYAIGDVLNIKIIHPEPSAQDHVIHLKIICLWAKSNPERKGCFDYGFKILSRTIVDN
ncbi:MAG: PilZ domain-containing protein [Candidatus Margulisiibacteriota bacterium]